MGLRKVGLGIASVGLVALLTGCDCPKPRMGCLPTPTLGTRFGGIEDLKKKSLLNSGNMIVYTRYGGHVDIDHLCETADWTVYLAKKSEDCLNKKEKKLDFRFDGSAYSLEINYPENWDNLSLDEKKRVSEDISINLGEYLAFSATTFHEIMTWFNYMPHFPISERPSSFSWEDMFSNAIGCYTAVIALKDKSKPINGSLNSVIENELLSLDIQPTEVSRRASEKMKGEWYDTFASFCSNMKKRHFDIGLENGYITPVLVPGIDDNAKPRAYPVPKLDFLKDYGFSARLKITPEVAERNSVLRIIYPNGKREKYIEPEKDYAGIMRHIMKEDAKNN